MRLRSILTAFTLSTVLLVSAGVLHGQVPARTTSLRDVDKPLMQFTSLLDLIEENYATSVDSEKAVQGAIDGMLRTLDPHSHYSDPKAFAQMIEDQRGRYYGLGITITTRFGKVTVVSRPFKNSPAERADLRVGDVIGKVNGEPTQGMDLNTVVSKIKGPKGTTVHISVVRAGVDEPMEMSIVRDEIAKYTINSAFIIKPGVGYIKLDSFAETSGQELRNALKTLDAENLKGLIFDLRANPGGLLQAAIEVSETFLQKGQAILETRGRTRGSNRSYVSQLVNTSNRFPIVVLVNQNTASAAEIVSGALQDHDRALIVGQTSFGKGLVQSIYPLENRGALALTTQKWYTPSGRLIQRDYSHISQFDYYNHKESGEPKTTDIRHSDLGRIVYGGGGITPDYVVKQPEPSEFQTMIASRFAIFTFGREFLAKNPVINPDFQVSDDVIAEFKSHLRNRNIGFTDKDIQDNLDYLKRAIRFELVYDKFGSSDASRTLLDDDPQVLKALSLFPEAKALADRARMAQKRGN
jgi:carboxyl-terminal processing protease